MSKYFITTPIYYINDVPHIGHAYTTIAADVLARYHRAKGDEVFFLTGTDEHGAKIAEAAKKAAKEPQAFVDNLEKKFKEAWKNLNISYDEFFRTTNPDHEKQVQEFVQKLKDRGFVEKRSYEGLYCVGCEKFMKESELVDGKCPDHLKEPVRQKEENYFFKLSDSAISNKLINLISNNEFVIGPESRRNEIISKLKLGIEDISISRATVEWGIPFPGDESQTIYVWIDALLNYYTATKIYGKDDFWPANLHLMAKDILWFHAVIWPSMLLALDLPLPKKVFAHGFFTVDNQKMSKTIGNVLNPNDLVDKFGADAVRYAVLREFPFGEDGDISLDKIATQYNNLGNNLGNLVQRTISMMVKYKIRNTKFETNNKIQIDNEINNLDFMEALKKIDDFCMEQNKYIAEHEPWVLAKEGKKQELTDVLATVYNNLILLPDLLLPFMPETAEKMKKQLETLEPEPLFPRLDNSPYAVKQ